MDRLLDTLCKRTLAGCIGLLLFVAGICFPANAADPLSDPTRPEKPAGARSSSARSEQNSSPSWELSSIIRSPRRKLAVINGKIRQAGEDIGGARILAIKPHAVVLLYRGERRTLRLFPQGAGLERTEDEQGVNK